MPINLLVVKSLSDPFPPNDFKKFLFFSFIINLLPNTAIITEINYMYFIYFYKKYSTGNRQFSQYYSIRSLNILIKMDIKLNHNLNLFISSKRIIKISILQLL